MTNWYLLPGNTALSLVLIILRSSIVVKITAGKMIELSLSTFGNVSIQMYKVYFLICKYVAHRVLYIIILHIVKDN